MAAPLTVWEQAQTWEAGWWGDCANTYGEEEKQLIYAQKMGLQFFHNGKSPYNLNLEGKNIVDLGSGPSSLLLKGINRGSNCTVVDPGGFPEWVTARYTVAGLRFLNIPAEEFTETGFEEVWIYNCLQHTQDPPRIIANALRAGKIVRLFEWVDTVRNEGHPHVLKAEQLDVWLRGVGKVETLQQGTLRGPCYYGIFLGDQA
jgi:hypothetical protein